MRAMPENNNKTHRLTMALLISLLLAACSNSASVSSPDRRISFEFRTDENGAPCYAVRFDGEIVVKTSQLGLEFRQRDSLVDDVPTHWDGNPYGIEIETHTLNSETMLELRLAAGGGTAIRFRTAEKAAT